MVGTVFETLDDVKAAVGTPLGASDWVEVTQDRVNQFADATGDHQWIHTDVERARRESPFRGPIAHGYLTLGVNTRIRITVEIEGGDKPACVVDSLSRWLA